MSPYTTADAVHATNVVAQTLPPTLAAEVDAILLDVLGVAAVRCPACPWVSYVRPARATAWLAEHQALVHPVVP